MKHEIHTRHYQITLDKLLQPTVADAVRDAPFFAELGLDCDTAEDRAKLCIPYWQRDYDWGSELIANFLASVRDIFGSENTSNRPLRLGTIVLGQLKQTKNPQYKENELFVIDGQQRLRTLCFLFSKARSLVTSLQGDALKLPLYYGVGEHIEDAWDRNNLDNYLVTDDQKKAFADENLVNLNLSGRTLSRCFSSIEAHIIVVTFDFDARHRDENIFDRTMSRLFSRINLHSQPLNDLDVVKAQLIFQMRKLALAEESSVLARQWEVARALLRTNSEAGKETIDALLSKGMLCDFDDEVLASAFSGMPRTSRESQQVQLSRYLLLVKAFADKNQTKLAHNEAADLLRSQGKLWESFKPLCYPTDAPENLEAVKTSLKSFVSALATVNNIFLNWRSVLLLSRAQLTTDHVPDEKDLKVTEKVKWKLLRFQCFLASASSDRVWLESPTLLMILRDIDANSYVPDSLANLGAVLRHAESRVFQKLGQSFEGKSGQHDILTARDWFLWQALFEPEDKKKNPCFSKAAEALQTVLDQGCIAFKGPQKGESADTARAGAKLDGTGLLRNLRLHVKRPEKLPTSTGAEEIEHWISMQRGKTLRSGVQERCNTTENMAHIANGTNQSLRDNTILNKANQISNDWWPTLQFHAAIVLEHRTAIGVLADQTKLAHVVKFLDGLKLFWSEVGMKYAPKGK